MTRLHLKVAAARHDRLREQVLHLSQNSLSLCVSKEGPKNPPNAPARTGLSLSLSLSRSLALSLSRSLSPSLSLPLHSTICDYLIGELTKPISNYSTNYG